MKKIKNILKKKNRFKIVCLTAYSKNIAEIIDKYADIILVEDSLSKFTTQHPIEMYIEDAEGGFQGEKEIMSQFGLENRNEITFVVSKQRFQQMDSQITLEDGTGTTGGSVLLEAGSIPRSSLSAVLDTPTKSFIELYCGNNALNTKELAEVVPIYIN